MADSGQRTEDEPRQLTRRGQERRQKLLEFATRRFAENGFHPTSVAEIVDGVGVGKGVFYWYFESKDQLLAHILRDALHELRSSQAEAMAGAVEPVERLEAGIRAAFYWSSSNPDLIRLAMFCWSEPDFTQAMKRGRDIVVGDSAKILQEAIDAGDIEPGNAVMMATAIHGVTDALAREFATAEHEVSPDLIENAVRVCLRGIRG